MMKQYNENYNDYRETILKYTLKLHEKGEIDVDNDTPDHVIATLLKWDNLAHISHKYYYRIYGVLHEVFGDKFTLPNFNPNNYVYFRDRNYNDILIITEPDGAKLGTRTLAGYDSPCGIVFAPVNSSYEDHILNWKKFNLKASSSIDIWNWDSEQYVVVVCKYPLSDNGQYGYILLPKDIQE